MTEMVGAVCSTHNSPNGNLIKETRCGEFMCVKKGKVLSIWMIEFHI